MALGLLARPRGDIRYWRICRVPPSTAIRCKGLVRRTVRPAGVRPEREAPTSKSRARNRAPCRLLTSCSYLVRAAEKLCWNSSDGLARREGEDLAALVVQPIGVSRHHLAPPLHRRHPAVGAFRGVEAVRQRSLCEITRDVADVTTPITKAASPAMRRASVYPRLGRRGGEAGVGERRA